MESFKKPWVILALAVLANAAMLCVDYELFSAGSVELKLTKVVGALCLNVLAFLGAPLINKAVQK